MDPKLVGAARQFLQQFSSVHALAEEVLVAAKLETAVETLERRQEANQKELESISADVKRAWADRDTAVMEAKNILAKAAEERAEILARVAQSEVEAQDKVAEIIAKAEADARAIVAAKSNVTKEITALEKQRDAVAQDLKALKTELEGLRARFA